MRIGIEGDEPVEWGFVTQADAEAALERLIAALPAAVAAKLNVPFVASSPSKES
jgi:hypothetical protein